MGRSNTRVILLIIAAALILVLISLGQYSSSSAGISCVREGYLVFNKIITSPFTFIADLWKDYIYLVDTKRDNEELKKSNDALRVQSMNLEELRSENERLRLMLDFKAAHTEFSLYPASLLAQDITLVFKTAVIDKGSRSGFFVNMPIVNPDGVVGRVVAVSSHTSQILMITDPNSAIPALIASTRVKGIVKGTGGESLRLEYVRRTDDVKIGDFVVTSGLLGIFPKGLRIGYVKDIQVDERKIFADILLAPCVDMEKIEGIFGIGQDVATTD
ncbi:MAG TPA: rod shape-determining protein MreC [Deltaproteobacteria bacterium]|nr:rod shape-determining protein MreC [Deltaproteobacteria bacterium]HPJ92852.1 rod shape-determining protein MreC [Deltaproteobacteria bacterium]HPR51019.1 rod shape-determining protein MreC [Deltaproteobacteria bacterium]